MTNRILAILLATMLALAACQAGEPPAHTSPPPAPERPDERPDERPEEPREPERPQEPAEPPRFQSIQWTEVADAPLGVVEAQGTAVDGRLYVFGGYTSWTPFRTTTSSWSYDPATDVWTALAPMPDAWTHAAVAVDGRDIILAGGHRNPNDRDYEDGRGLIPDGERTVLRYNIDDDAWYDDLPELPEARGSGGLERVGRSLHFFGGHTPDPLDFGTRADVGDHWVLDLDDPQGGWRPLAPLPNPRNHLGSAVLDGSIYVVGGQHDHNEDSVHQTDVHRYDPAANAWTAVASLPEPLSHHTAVTFAMDGGIVVLGGERDHTEDVAIVLVYDPLEDAWTQRGSLPTARGSAVGGLIDGVFYLTGGGDTFDAGTIRGVPVP